MNAVTIGLLTGIALAAIGLAFGFWGFLLAVVLGAIGALIGAVASRKVDLRAAIDAARGRSAG
ncbi:hypothetical protein OVA14_04780 [Agrococcus sp. SL85]|uniref:DUF2273 domain-containing protein n=1 Tax=Agrococcus sp. SL85 TaxID=2995141 RepID=UPI00226D1963|nr:hypothetical protein [Agrococcus sp. SL85]WAC67073.1 hypothetical protein OVA14_04780 [Agrococcus sp. SL85]